MKAEASPCVRSAARLSSISNWQTNLTFVRARRVADCDYSSLVAKWCCGNLVITPSAV